MSARSIDMPSISESFTKNDYFAMASEKMGLTEVEMTQFIWESYDPGRIMYVIVGIGILTITALFVYDRLVIRPNERNGN